MSSLRKRSRADVSDVVTLANRISTNEDIRRLHLVSRQTTWDEEHPLFHRIQEIINRPGNHWMKKGGALQDMGGDFTSHRTSSRVLGDYVFLKAIKSGGDYLYKFNGPLVPGYPNPANPSPDSKIPSDNGRTVVFDSYYQDAQKWDTLTNTDASMQTFGASAVSKLAPTAPHNSVYTSLGELRNDGLPSIPGLSFLKKDGKLPKDAGGEYLNYQFGLVPTYSDLKNIKETIDKAEKLWKQYLRDSGNIVRRRMNTDPETTTTTTELRPAGSSYPYNTGYYHWTSVGPVISTTRTTRERWVSAAFQYYVSPLSTSGLAGFAERTNYLYGWKPTPSAAYNLQAWTWLIDWFTNSGDVIENISLYLNDPQLMRWGYVMEKSTRVTTISQRCVDNDGTPRTATIEFTSVSKKRRRINPFHFGLLYEDLNGRQLAILAALGLTRFSNPGSM